LQTAVRVVDETLEVVMAAPDGHLQRVEGEVGSQGGGDPPADDATGEHISDERRGGEA
jgi:hypothetical protein